MEEDTLINREITMLELMIINIRLPPIYTTEYIITELIVGERLGIPPPYLKTTSLLFQTNGTEQNVQKTYSLPDVGPHKV